MADDQTSSSGRQDTQQDVACVSSVLGCRQPAATDRRELCDGNDDGDDVSSSLLLLNLLDKQTVAHSKFWFERNMLNLTKDGAASLIFGASERVSDLAKERLRAYRVFLNEDGSDWESD